MRVRSFRSGSVLVAIVGIVAVSSAGWAAGANKHAEPPKVLRIAATGTVQFSHQMYDNKEMDLYTLRVVKAKDADGKELPAWSGKVLRIRGAKLPEAQKLTGKMVEAVGVSRDARTIDITTIHELAAPTPSPKGKR